MPSVQLTSRVQRIIQEVAKIAKVTVTPPKEIYVSSLDMDLKKLVTTINGVTATFIYGTGYHAHDEDGLDILFDAPEAEVGELTYVDELYNSMAKEVAMDIVHSIDYAWNSK